VFYLDGGGVRFDATSCAFTSTGGEGKNDFHNWNLSGENPAFPGGGILDFDRADNPFAHYSFIYVGSCTGDLDLGDVTREYSPELTAEHNGFVNGTAALGRCGRSSEVPTSPRPCRERARRSVLGRPLA
jgi:hypothetical protein